MTVSASTDIDAPAAAIFDILADPRQHQLIDGSGTVKSSVSGPDRLELGSKFSMNMKQGAPYRVTSKVAEFEEDRLIAWHHFAQNRWRYELEPTPGGGTRVTETWDISQVPAPVRAFFKLVGLPAKTQRGIEQSLVNLKEAAEQDPESTP